jgi:hypothetical protein
VKVARTAIIPQMKAIVAVWSRQDWDWVCDGCADVSYALWRIGQQLGWPVKLVAGTATMKGGERFPHAWLTVNGKIFDPVAYANHYRVARYSPDKGDPLKAIRDIFGVETDELYGFNVSSAIKQLGLAEAIATAHREAARFRGMHKARRHLPGKLAFTLRRNATGSFVNSKLASYLRRPVA